MITYSPMASGKGVNEVCGLIKYPHCVSCINIVKLAKMALLSRRYAKQTNIFTTVKSFVLLPIKMG